MSTSRDRLGGRLETLERMLKPPVDWACLIVPTTVPRDDRDDWIEEHVRAGRSLSFRRRNTVMTIRRERMEKRLPSWSRRLGRHGGSRLSFVGRS